MTDFPPDLSAKSALRWPAWLPFFGWRMMDPEDVEELGMDVRWQWRVLMVEWFGRGFFFFASPVRRIEQ